MRVRASFVYSRWWLLLQLRLKLSHHRLQKGKDLLDLPIVEMNPGEMPDGFSFRTGLLFLPATQKEGAVVLNAVSFSSHWILVVHHPATSLTYPGDEQLAPPGHVTILAGNRYDSVTRSVIERVYYDYCETARKRL